jgi:regulator of protease activity HflC (stomatin/prohibitin superfamily)
VEKAEQERQAAVIRAEGEAEAANTISKALNRAGDAFVQFRKIEAAREIGTYFFLLSSSLFTLFYPLLLFILTSCSVTIVL